MSKLVIFDSDGVLVNEFDRAAHKLFVKSFLQKHGVIKKGMSKRTSSRIVERQSKMWKDIESKALVGKISHRRANEFWIKKFGLKKSLAKEFLSGDYDFWEKSVKPQPEVKETLRKLKLRGYELAVLSNDVRQGFLKRRILSCAGISKYLDKVYTSHSIGHPKPDKEAYLYIVRQFGAKPNETFFVGHQDYEIKGAKRARLKAVCFNKKPNKSADYNIKRFSGLLRID